MKHLPTLTAAAALALLAPVAINAHLRFAYQQTLAHWWAKVDPPRTVFLGDSIIAGGSAFGELTAISRATNGLQTHQIAAAVPGALRYKPERIVVMAGMNDAVEGPIDTARQAALWRQICSDPRMIVVQATPTRSAVYNARLDAINRIALARCPLVLGTDALRGEDGLLRSEYTVDGVHLSDAGYRVLRRVIEGDG